MNPRFSAMAAALGALLTLAAACSSSRGKGSPSHPESGDDTGSPSPEGGTLEASNPDASDDDSPPAPQTLVRIAHLSPDLPAIDVCIAAHGTADFQGPLVGQLAASLAGGDGGAADASLPGLVYPQVSAYLAVDPGSYDVRVVAAGAADCTVALASLDDGGAGVPDTTGLPAIAFDTDATLLIAGDVSPAGADGALTLTLLTDDAVLAGGAAVLRGVNAEPSRPSLDFGFRSSSGAWSPVLANVAFAAASTQAAPGYGAPDANGYLAIAPVAGASMSAQPADEDAGGEVASASRVEIDLGSVATVFAVGGKTGDASHPPALLLCVDNEPSGGLLSDCSIAP